MYIVSDFETRSRCDLKKCGAAVYSEDISTEIICLGYQISTGPVCQWRPEHGAIPLDLAQAIQDGGILVAHNALFEKSIWRSIMVPLYHWPDVPNEQWFDTMATCAYRSLPLKLKDAAKVLELPTQKGDVPLKYFRPARDGTFLEPGPDLFEYNIADVEAEAQLLRRIGLPSREELAVWHLDQQINARGVAIDLAYVAAGQEVVQQATRPLQAELAGLTEGLAPGQTAKILGWCWDQGAFIPNLQAETIKSYLGANFDDQEDDDLGPEELEARTVSPLPGNIRRALEIRRILGSASIKKLQRIPHVVGVDGRARGLLQYHGATTGRWTGRLLQPQNFPRGTVKIDGEAPDPQLLVDAIMSRDASFVDMFFGNPIAAVASGLRHCLVASHGHSFVVGDFSTVEARVVLALAGQTDKVELLRKGENLYLPMGKLIFGRDIDKHKDPQEYVFSKSTVLGAGFQMGYKKFQDRYARDKDEEFCRETIRTYREDFAPCVPLLWAGLGNAALRTVQSGRPHDHAGILYERKDRWLTARLPSGRRLWYFNPQLKKKAMPWDKTDIREIFTYQTQKSGQWVTVDAYGGSLTANVVQATARDLLVSAMFRCEEENLKLVLTVHDEAIVEVPSSRADPLALEQIMCDIPGWARERGIPVAAECWAGDRYRK